MSFKEQVDKLKNNWLMIVLIIVVLLLVLTFSGSANYNTRALYSSQVAGGYSESAMMDYDVRTSYTQPSSQGTDFAPEVELRKIVKNANLRLELKLGTFHETDSKIKSIANTSNSYILSENISSRKSGSKNVYTGNYVIKVESTKLDAMVNQLKDLGDVTSIYSGATDVTGNYTSTEIELEAERNRLNRYLELYNSSDEDGKIKMINSIFNHERRIKYLEDSLRNIDQRVEYSTISLSVSEKYNFANIVFVKFSDLIRTFVNSFNSVLKIIFGVVPYLLLLYLIVLGFRLFRRKKKVTEENFKKIKK